MLVGERVAPSGEAHDAARALVTRWGAHAALVKGGHLDEHGDTAIDVLAVGDEVLELRARRLPGAGAHGTGCVFASLVAGRLALRPRRASPRRASSRSCDGSSARTTPRSRARSTWEAARA